MLVKTINSKQNEVRLHLKKKIELNERQWFTEVQDW